jgi:hypothetical protein
MYCTNCGAAASDQAIFCSRCGTRMITEDSGATLTTEDRAPTPVAVDSGHLGEAATEFSRPATVGSSPDGDQAQPTGYPQADTQQVPLQPTWEPQPARPAEPPSPPASPPSRHRRRTAVIAVGTAVLVLAALALTGWQESWPPAVFGSAPRPLARHTAPPPPPPLAWSAAEAPLPADAVRGTSQNAALFAVSCPSAGSCVGVGNYQENSGSKAVTAGLAETLADGVWTPTAVTGLTGTSLGSASLSGVSCPAKGNCVAVGFRTDSHTLTNPVIESLSGGHWTASAAPLPDNANQQTAGSLTGISCTGPGTCVASGWYLDGNDKSLGLFEMLSGGTWTAAEAPLPADAAPSKETQQTNTILNNVACPALGSCVATGQYTNSSGAEEGLLDTLSDGGWRAATAPMPADAVGTGQFAGLFAIACQAPGSCLAGGHYKNKGGQPRYLIDSLSAGRWSTMSAALPADAAANQEWTQDLATSIDGLACRAAGSCVAPAGYVTGEGGVDGVVSTLTGGTWRTAHLPSPFGAATAAKESVYPMAVTCPTRGSCYAVGDYASADGSSQALIETAV